MFAQSLLTPFSSFRVYGIENESRIDDRFKFPQFELTNWYAAKAVTEDLKGKHLSLLVDLDLLIFSSFVLSLVLLFFSASLIFHTGSGAFLLSLFYALIARCSNIKLYCFFLWNSDFL